MKTLARIITALLVAFFYCLPTLAEGYSVLVIPDSCVIANKKNMVANIDIEELLARKFIDKLEASGNDYAPTLRVLKISIKNNPAFNKNATDRLENAKILSASYGVPKVLLVSSRIENKMNTKKHQTGTNLPILSQQNTNTRVVTKLTMYNTKTNEVMWSDVYYKNIDDLVCSNPEIVNAYYDELIPKVLTSVKSTKETHAVIVGNNKVNRIEDTAPKTVTKPTVTKPITNTVAQTKTVKPTVQKKAEPKTALKPIPTVKPTVKQQPTSFNTTSANALTPDLRMTEEVNKTKPTVKKENKLVSLKNNLHNKYEHYQHERKIASLEKKSAQQTKQVKQQPKQPEKVVKKPETKEVKKAIKPTEKTIKPTVAQTKEVKPNVQKQKSDEKTLAQWLKEKHETLQSNKAKATEPKVKTEKVVKEKTVKPTAKSEKIVKEKTVKPTVKTEKVAKEKTVKPKTAETKPAKVKTAKKPDNERFSAKIKTKYANLKAKYEENKAKKVKESEENVKYTTLILENNENNPSATRYINTRPRYNAVNYTPSFDTSVNDI